MADPARVVSTPRTPFTWVGGWQVTSPRGVAAIAQRYGGAQANPNLGLSGAVQASDANMLRDAADKATRDLQTAANTAQNEQNIAATEERSNEASASRMVPGGINSNVQPGHVAGATIPSAGGGLVGNPNLHDRAVQNWMDMGGSEATMHRAEVARGIRPAIDARATPAWQDQGQSASDQIREGWGWPSSDFGNSGAQIWSEMTGRFNNSAAAVKARNDRAAALAQARGELEKHFGPDIPAAPAAPPMPATPSPLPQPTPMGAVRAVSTPVTNPNLPSDEEMVA